MLSVAAPLRARRELQAARFLSPRGRRRGAAPLSGCPGLGLAAPCSLSKAASFRRSEPLSSRRKPSAGTTGCGRQGQAAASGPRRRPGPVERSGSAGLRPLCRPSCGKCGRSRRAVCSVSVRPPSRLLVPFRLFQHRKGTRELGQVSQLWNGVSML